MSKVTTKAKLVSSSDCTTPRESRREKSMREMVDKGSVLYRCGRYKDSVWYSMNLVFPRLIFATVPRVFGIGPMVSRKPASVSLCRYRLLISRGKNTGPH